jgi:multisubunit Na+/H+ antiporter MnhE subunit
MKSLLLNLLIAIMWLLLSAEPSVTTFTLGGLMGFALLAVFHRVLGSGDYVRRVLALGRFALVFTREFLLANARVVWTVLFRSRESLNPNFITYDVAGLKPIEILILSHCITLTPGTTAVKVTDDFQTLVVHVLHADDADAIRAQIDRVLKRGILSFTR